MLHKLEPTIFIGIGKTGFKVINNLISRFSETNEVYALPIYKFISIGFQTDTFEEIEDEKNNLLMKYRNEIIRFPYNCKSHIDINNEMASKSINGGNYNEEWFNEIANCLNEEIVLSDNHSKHSRINQWNEFEELNKILKAFTEQIVSNQGVILTNKIIPQFYGNKNHDKKMEIKDAKKAFIFGSLSGGTGSGLLIDIAHLLKRYNYLSEAVLVASNTVKFDEKCPSQYNNLENIFRKMTDKMKISNCYTDTLLKSITLMSDQDLNIYDELIAKVIPPNN